MLTEYIGQLVHEISRKNNECHHLRHENIGLKAENDGFKQLIESMMSHQAFRPYLAEFQTQAESIVPSVPAPTMPSMSPTPMLASQGGMQFPSFNDTNLFGDSSFGDAAFGAMSEADDSKSPLGAVAESDGYDTSMAQYNLQSPAWNDMNPENFNRIQPELQRPPGP